MNPSPSTAGIRHACTVLSSPALIRLITEIDDNGPIPSRGLARTLADLPSHHLRQSIDLARDLDLVHLRPGTGLGLTRSGAELSDVYDAMARWARRHSYPAPVSDFNRRIQHTLALLTEAPTFAFEGSPRAPTAGALLPSAEAAADLARLRDLLIQWLDANPQAANSAPAA
ncbi:hypothetical protein [Streptomyces meridianus]|uniref:Uncharacterized protein n=1 Tax=Streptomyces meridianus TaxID=2938945 RepID=A0ABT0XBQ8_9ACTN|nr:hypothetical protein [Streptomyces meridianus]MCM2579705.1 hypothetical protein [Streptomyces meridianus]